ncbi:MAG: ParB/Srx family N-terminal domain-containing protein [Psychrobacter sp.]
MLKINYKGTADLIPYVNNSRTHSEQQVQQVAASIKEFGFTNPILIDEDNGIIAGHGRILAAQKLNLDKVPTITLKDLTDAQRKAYVIADNKLALNSGWDDELLKVELENLSETDFNLDLLGWDVLPDFKDDIDYSILDEDDVDDELGEMTDDVKKAIQIEFESHDYEEAQEVVKFWRNKDAYVGGLILDYLRKEMNKL